MKKRFKKFLLINVLLLIILGFTSCKEVESQIKVNAKDTNSTDTKKENKIDEEDKQDKVETNLQSGVLLGLSAEDKTSNGRACNYRTLWIYSEGNSVKFAEIPKILVPVGNEWWVIESKKFEDKKPSEFAVNKGDMDTVSINDIVSYKLGDKYSANDKISKYGKSLLSNFKAVEENRKILFVGNKYVSVEADYYYNTGGTLRPYMKSVYVSQINGINRNYALVNLEDNLLPAGSDKSKIKKESMKEIIGKDTSSYIEKYKNTKITDDEQGLYGSSPKITNTTDEYGFTISRKNGKYVSQIAKKWEFSNGSTFSSSCTLYDMPINIPSTITSSNDLYPNWESIKETVPEAIDAVSSPTKDLLVVLTSNNILIFTNPKEGMKAPALTIKANNESLIMSQWATGQYVNKWTEQVQKFGGN